jgi:predicted flap endonuclease-1-like 5' DNA nuclease
MSDDLVTVRYVGDRTSFRSDPTGILREDETAAVSEAAADRLLENWPFEAVNDDSTEADDKDDSEGSDEDDSEEADGLTDLNGVGEDTADDLRAAGYETPADVRDADSDELTDVDGIGEATAADLVDESEG